MTFNNMYMEHDKKATQFNLGNYTIPKKIDLNSVEKKGKMDFNQLKE